MQIGPFKLSNRVIAAPMAGVSDKPYRHICRQFGAGLVVSEMVSSRADLRQSTKSLFRSDHAGEPEPVVVQLVGTEPNVLAKAAQYNILNGAQIIDINMGCPAKKVCKKAAGSALLQNEKLVEQILHDVVRSVAVPVTVKVRTGTNPETKNAVTIAKIAEQAGVAAITVHGRTRQCRFVGAVEYDTIAKVKQSVTIPVVANGDIDSPESAKFVIDKTNADAVMIGRAAQGQPWLFGQISHFLEHRELLDSPPVEKRIEAILKHIAAIHQFYGQNLGVKLARKHIKWYLHHWPEKQISPAEKLTMSTCVSSEEQYARLQHFLLNSHLEMVA